MANKQGVESADGADTELGALAKALGEGPEAAATEGETGWDPLDTAETVARLKACAARRAKVHTFAPGQLVMWKKGLKNKRTPAYGEPIVVVAVLDTPVLDKAEDNAGSCYFREPLTLIAGELDNAGVFLCYHYDARLFEPYKG